MKKKLLTALLFFASVNVTAAETPEWTVTKNVSPFSYTAEFIINKHGTPQGRVERTGFLTPRYYYDLYDANNVFQMRGITRAFSLGLLYSWGMEIDLYDNQGWVGEIQGKIITNSRAKFSFYDQHGTSVATAHLNDESSNFLIVSTQNEGLPIAELTGRVYGDSSVWDMTALSSSSSLDERAVQVFAGFVSDFQNDFIRPPKVEVQVYHHHHHDREW